MTETPAGRLVGLETEYAVYFSGPRRPPHGVIYRALLAALRARRPTFSGERVWREQVFIPNGGAFLYEYQPTHPEDGLIEGATPECRCASQLVVYQRAQEELLKQALDEIRPHLGRRGHYGTVGLLKNARDAEGHTYGSQENYEIELAGWRLWAARLSLTVLIPLVLINLIIGLAVAAMIVVLTLVVSAVYAVVAIFSRRTRRTFAEWIDFDDEGYRGSPPGGLKLLDLLTRGLTAVLELPTFIGFRWLYGGLVFGPYERGLLAHLASRTLYTGAGCWVDDTFWLSERAATVVAVHRQRSQQGPPVFDNGNFIKALWSPLSLRFRPLASLFSPRHRIQISCGDPNRCQVAELLKIGTTLVLLDMTEAGYLADAPRLANPLRALRSIALDPGVKVRLTDGRQMDALALQRWYLARAQRFLAEAPSVSMDTHQVVRLWSAVLDQWAADPSKLIGRVDWLTKRHLVEASGLSDEPLARKKADLRYAEIGTGYFDRLAARGLTEDVVPFSAVQAAMDRPPDDSPARVRSELLRDLSDHATRIRVAWDHVRVGAKMTGKVIRLVDRKRSSSAGDDSPR